MNGNLENMEENLRAVQEDLVRALESAGRLADDCQIVAFTKRQANEKIAAALGDGDDR